MDPKTIPGKCVLVVDDDPLILQLLETALPHRGFDVVLACGGAEGVRVFGEQHATIDAVLLDVRMPEVDGPATLTKLKEIEPKVRCLLMSGDIRPYTTADLLALGSSGLILKPFTSLDDLGRQLRELCSADR